MKIGTNMKTDKQYSYQGNTFYAPKTEKQNYDKIEILDHDQIIEAMNYGLELEKKLEDLMKDFDFCSGGWNVEVTIGSTVYEIMKAMRLKHSLSTNTFSNILKDSL
jgi:hypothetical protein